MHLVGQAGRVGEVVQHHENHAACASEVAKQLIEAKGSPEIQRRKWLVEEEHRRFGGEGTRNDCALALARREIREGAFVKFFDAAACERATGLEFDRGPRFAAMSASERDHMGDAHVFWNCGRLRNPCDESGAARRRRVVERVLAKANGATRGLEPSERAQKRGFTRAIRTKNRVKRSLRAQGFHVAQHDGGTAAHLVKVEGEVTHEAPRRVRLRDAREE